MVASEPIGPAALLPAGFSGFAVVSVFLRQGYLYILQIQSSMLLQPSPCSRCIFVNPSSPSSTSARRSGSATSRSSTVQALM